MILISNDRAKFLEQEKADVEEQNQKLTQELNMLKEKAEKDD